MQKHAGLHVHEHHRYDVIAKLQEHKRNREDHRNEVTAKLQEHT